MVFYCKKVQSRRTNGTNTSVGTKDNNIGDFLETKWPSKIGEPLGQYEGWYEVYVNGSNIYVKGPKGAPLGWYDVYVKGPKGAPLGWYEV